MTVGVLAFTLGVVVVATALWGWRRLKRWRGHWGTTLDTPDLVPKRAEFQLRAVQSTKLTLAFGVVLVVLGLIAMAT